MKTHSTYHDVRGRLEGCIKRLADLERKNEARIEEIKEEIRCIRKAIKK